MALPQTSAIKVREKEYVGVTIVNEYVQSLVEQGYINVTKELNKKRLEQDFALIGVQTSIKPADTIIRAFDYYADSIKLNVNSKKIIVGDVLNLKATVISNLSNANSLVKWNSSNVAVATVNSNGIVSAKKSGTATITAFIGNIKAKSIITVIEKEGNMDITCPGIEYDSSGNNITMKIMPTPSVKTYDIYYSTNKINGSWANWSIQHSNIVGNKSITINKNNTTQVKIVAKSANGTTRNCYSGSFITGNYTTSSIAKCPNFTYSDSKSGTLRNYKQDGIKTTS